MRALVVGGVGAPAGGLEGGAVHEAFVNGEKTLAYAVGNIVEVACAELVRDQPGGVSLWSRCGDGWVRTLPIGSPTW